jgi:mannose-1-phosphate guanylyltransferase/mannose-1-phosphate guanylyltransferase/phosphomannomutase
MTDLTQAAPLDCLVLGAGLGTRLRPLTDQLPKPLLPVGLKPLITFAFDHLIADASADTFIVNTHHLADSFSAAFPGGKYRDRLIHCRHEPVLLETGGGIRNISNLLRGDRPLLVYHGDILTDLPLAPAIAFHRGSGHLATMILRSTSGPKHVAFDSASGTVLDVRDRFGRGLPHQHAFTGIYLVEPALLEFIPTETKISIIPILVDLIRGGKAVGGIVIDEGEWRDLGSRKEYLEVHRALRSDLEERFPRYGAPDPRWREWISPQAQMGDGARVLGGSAIGAGAIVGEGALIDDSIVWPGGEVAAGARLRGCIVRGGSRATGELKGKDI